MLHILLYTYIIISYFIISIGNTLSPSINPEFYYLTKYSKSKKWIYLSNIFAPITILILLGTFLSYILYSILGEVFPEKKTGIPRR